ncbi:P-loop containing nucleoside triphosphate hydrolase protein [Gaertneriomyces semiglobifer]|nr:P-loop containing nucleoside triphosphate hydrolase protein [Gaertneriomyces semiglobifer]
MGIPDTFDAAKHYYDAFQKPMLADCYTAIFRNLEELDGDDRYRVPICDAKPLLAIPNKSGGNLKVSVSTERIRCRSRAQQTFCHDDVVLLEVRRRSWLAVAKRVTEGERHVEGQAQLQKRTFLNLYVLLDDSWDSENIEGCYVTMVSSLTPFKRIHEAIWQKQQPEFLKYITFSQGTTEYIGWYPIRLEDARLLLEDVMVKVQTPLNPAQTEAIMKAIAGGNPISLIQGPPGTGKTSVIVVLLLILYVEGWPSILSAATNLAVCEVARRIMKLLPKFRMVDEFGDLTEEIPLSTLLLMGSEEKMDLSGALDKIFLESRCTRVIAAINGLTNTSMAWVTQLANFPEGYLQMDEEQLSRELSKYPREMAEQMRPTLIRFCSDYGAKTPVDLMLVFRDLWAQWTADIESWAITLLREGPPKCFDAFITWVKDLLRRIKPIKRRLDMLRLCNVGTPGIRYGRHTYLPPGCSRVMTDDARRFVRTAIVNEALLIFSTIVACGRQALRPVWKKSPVWVLDEASQANEASTLGMLKSEARRLVLVGDQKQLPATVVSDRAVATGYRRSLFDRLVSLGYPSSLLDIQYRMHPEISIFPRWEFYAGAVRDSENVRGEAYHGSWCRHTHLRPYMYLDAPGLTESVDAASRSVYNPVEAQLVEALIDDIFEHLVQPYERTWEIGVVSGYSRQVEVMPAVSINGFTIDVGTVDRFQGQERDIIIFATTRANTKGNLGFLTDARRLNVALTRARYSLWIVGDAGTLKHDIVWDRLLRDLRYRGLFFDVFKSEQFKSYLSKGEVWKATIETKSREAAALPISSGATVNVGPVYADDRWNLHIAKAAFDRLKRRPAFIQRLSELREGKWTKKAVTRVGPGTILNCMKVGEMCVLWSLFLAAELGYYKQVIKIWHIVPTGEYDKTVSDICRIMSSLTEDVLSCCELPEKVSGQPPIYGPKMYPRPEKGGILFYKQLKGLTAFEETEIDATEEDAMAYVKTYSLRTHYLNILANGAMATVELPFELSEEERLIIRYPKSLIIVGRSGTGKTTVMLQKMCVRHVGLSEHEGALEFELGDVEDGHPAMPQPHQLMLTVSSRLSSMMREHYQNLLKPFASTKEVEGVHSRFLTFRQFLQTIDDKLNPSFFKRRLQAIVRDVESLTWRAGGQNDIGKDEVDSVKFTNYYYPHLRQQVTKQFSSSFLWTEFQSVIKGSAAAIENISGTLSAQQYIGLARARGSFLTEGECDMIYQSWLNYECEKRNRREYDLADATLFVFRGLSRGDVAENYHYLYVDEVQDLTQAQLALLKYVCRNPDGFTFAGDTAQTISGGVSFRFEDLKSLFFSHFLPSLLPEKYGGNKGSMKLTQAGSDVPALRSLTQNYRTHSGVIDVASNVVDILTTLFPYAIDKLDRERAICAGPAPVVLRESSLESLVVALFGSGDVARDSELGAEQVIIVRNDTARRKLEAKVPDALVLTVLESKGLEFRDVLLVDFLKDSLYRNWRVLLGIGNNADNSIHHPKFDERKDYALCSELKALYVAVTRAKCRLWMYDSDEARREILVNFWLRSNVFVSYIKAQEASAPLARRSSAEGWEERGTSFKEKEMWQQAAMCFKHAKLETEHAFCRGKLLSTQADQKKGQGDLSAAKAAFVEAGAVFEGAKFYNEAGLCFYEATQWSKAVNNFVSAENLDDALRTCVKGRLVDTFLKLAEENTSPPATVEEGATKLARLEHRRGNKAAVVKLIGVIRSETAQRKFLQRYKYFDELIKRDMKCGLPKEVADTFAMMKRWGDSVCYLLKAERIGAARETVLNVARSQAFLAVWRAHENVATHSDVLDYLTTLNFEKGSAEAEALGLLTILLKDPAQRDWISLVRAIDTLRELSTEFVDRYQAMQKSNTADRGCEHFLGLMRHEQLADYRVIDPDVYIVLRRQSAPRKEEMSLTTVADLAVQFLRANIGSLLRQAETVFIRAMEHDESTLDKDFQALRGNQEERKARVSAYTRKNIDQLLEFLRLARSFEKECYISGNCYVDILERWLVEKLLFPVESKLCDYGIRYVMLRSPRVQAYIEDHKALQVYSSEAINWTLNSLCDAMLLYDMGFGIPDITRFKGRSPPPSYEDQWHLWNGFAWLHRQRQPGRRNAPLARFGHMVGVVCDKVILSASRRRYAMHPHNFVLLMEKVVTAQLLVNTLPAGMTVLPVRLFLSAISGHEKLLSVYLGPGDRACWPDLLIVKRGLCWLLSSEASNTWNEWKAIYKVSDREQHALAARLMILIILLYLNLHGLRNSYEPRQFVRCIKQMYQLPWVGCRERLRICLDKINEYSEPRAICVDMSAVLEALGEETVVAMYYMVRMVPYQYRGVRIATWDDGAKQYILNLTPVIGQSAERMRQAMFAQTERKEIVQRSERPNATMEQDTEAVSEMEDIVVTAEAAPEDESTSGRFPVVTARLKEHLTSARSRILKRNEVLSPAQLHWNSARILLEQQGASAKFIATYKVHAVEVRARLVDAISRLKNEAENFEADNEVEQFDHACNTLETLRDCLNRLDVMSECSTYQRRGWPVKELTEAKKTAVEALAEV